MEQLSLFREFHAGIDVADSILASRLKGIKTPEDFRVFGRSIGGKAHEIGIEREKDGEGGHRPPIVALPGFCHGNWSYIKLIEALADKGIEISAVSPFGEEATGPMQKPPESWTMEDYLNPYRNYLKDKNREVVLLGHSLGGLQAQILATQLRSQIRGLILINSVKPSNLCQRRYSVVSRDGAEFRPNENMKWILEELFNGEFPEDITWIIDRLKLAIGSNNVIDDYGGENGRVDPKLIGKSVLEFSGTEDGGQTTGIHGNRHEMVVEEEEGFIREQRMSITDFFLKSGNCPYGKKIDIDNGSHNSLILGKHVKEVAQGIWDNISIFE